MSKARSSWHVHRKQTKKKNEREKHHTCTQAATRPTDHAQTEASRRTMSRHTNTERKVKKRHRVRGCGPVNMRASSMRMTSFSSTRRSVLSNSSRI
eukprot:3937585-Rhodomonas_salina.3